MTKEELVRKARDSSVSDEVVYKELIEYVDDESHNIEEVCIVGDIMRIMRPNVMIKMRELILHEDCGHEGHKDPKQ